MNNPRYPIKKTLSKWKTEGRESVGDFRIFNIEKRRNRSPKSGKDGEFFVMESPNWINVIPVNTKGEVVLVEQFRHGLNDVTFEIPGGCVDHGDENPLVSAKRELMEETGYTSQKWHHIGTNSPNPAINTNWCYSFLALNVELTQDQNLDNMEEIAVHTVPLLEIPNLIKQGRILHSLVISAFFFLKHWDGKDMNH